MNKEELGSWLIYEKAVIIADIDKYIRRYMNNHFNTPFTESSYIEKLSELVMNYVYKEICYYKSNEIGIEQILLLLEEPEIKLIIKTHYLREWLYD